MATIGPTGKQMAVASRPQKLQKDMTMSQNTKAAAEFELRPLDDRQLEMAHAVDAIDQALSKAGLTWSALAEIVAYMGLQTGSGIVGSSAKKRCRDLVPSTQSLARPKPCSRSLHSRREL